MPATFLLVCFLSLNERTRQTRKHIFYFTSKALFFLEKIKFENLRFSDFTRHQIPKHRTKKYILLNNLRSKHSLLMKLDQFMSYSKRNNFIEKFCKNCGLKTCSRPFCDGKEYYNLYCKIKFLKQSTYIT